VVILLLLKGLLHDEASSSGNSVDKLSNPLPQQSKIRPPSIFISEVTHRAHRKDSEHCILSEDWNPVLKNPQQILGVRVPLNHGDAPRCTIGGGLMYAIVFQWESD